MSSHCRPVPAIKQLNKRIPKGALEIRPYELALTSRLNADLIRAMRRVVVLRYLTRKAERRLKQLIAGVVTHD